MLTPDDIEGRDFLVSLRGFDRAEVRSFLQEVAAHVRTLESKAEAADRRAEAAEEWTPEPPGPAPAPEPPAAPAPEVPADASAMFADIGRETQRILEAAQEAAEGILRQARVDAEREVQLARRQSARIIAEAEQERDRVEAVVAGLDAARDSLSGNLRDVSNTIERVLSELAAPAVATVREALAAEVDEPVPAEPPTSGPVFDVPAAVDEVAAVTDVEVVPGPGGQAAPVDHAGGDARADVAADDSAGPEGAVDREGAAGHEGAADRAADEAAEQGPEVEAEGEPSDPQGLREMALSSLHPQLARALKRELQDVQNLALDRLRRSGGQGDVDSLVPAEGIAGFGKVGAQPLEAAYREGVGAASLLADRDLPDPDVERSLATDFQTDATERVRNPLAATLRMGRSAADPPPALFDRIGAVFAELRSTVADELTANHLTRAYELGLLDAWTAGGVTRRRWVLGREPRCPEARCRHNDQVGVVAMGQAFPSGHDVPPVHVGCTCTTVPVPEPTP